MIYPVFNMLMTHAPLLIVLTIFRLCVMQHQIGKDNVMKCRYPSIYCGQIANVSSIKLDGLSVSSVITSPFNFLGMSISANLDTLDHCLSIQSRLKDLLLKVDKSLASRRQKLKLYSLAFCSRLCCPTSFVMC